MKVVAIHQPHYLPWLGFLDKMAKADEFIVLDDVQLTDRSPMLRNKLLQVNGQEKYLTVSVAKKGYREKRTKEILLSDWTEVRRKHRAFIELNYKKTMHYEEVMPYVERVFEKDFETLLDVDMATMRMLRSILGITTPMTMQSSLNYDSEAKNSDLMLSLCLADRADGYLSGCGARKYMNDASFEARGVKVRYQEFEPPEYSQYKQNSPVMGLSALDLAFQRGIDGAREVFYGNMKKEAW